MLPRKGTRKIKIGEDEYSWRVNASDYYMKIIIDHSSYPHHYEVFTNIVGQGIWLDMEVKDDSCFQAITPKTVKGIIDQMLIIQCGVDQKCDKYYYNGHDGKLQTLNETKISLNDRRKE